LTRNTILILDIPLILVIFEEFTKNSNVYGMSAAVILSGELNIF